MGQVWTPVSGPNRPWRTLAVSADGSGLLAGTTRFFMETNSGLFLSTNSGSIWSTNILTRSDWLSVAMSADGSKLYATGRNPNGFYASTNGGAIWTTNPYSFLQIACSADGNQTVGEGPAISTNAGVTWTFTTNAVAWNDIESSADGTTLLTVGNGRVWTSTNSGVNWTSNNVPGGASAAITADGRKMFAFWAASVSKFALFSSTNSGASWISNSIPRIFSDVAVSADGNVLLGLYDTGGYISTNLGSNWTPLAMPATSSSWVAIGCSADGGKIVAAEYSGRIYVSSSIRPPALEVALSTNAINLSWLVPSANFTLHANSYLNGDWATVTNVPSLNLSNLHNEVVLPIGEDRGFYRLAAPQWNQMGE